MTDVATFLGIPSIGHKIFQALPFNEDLQNCRLVCQSWKTLLEDPMFWLKKLYPKSHPIVDACKDWLHLIVKAQNYGVTKDKFAISLMTKFFMISQMNSQFEVIRMAKSRNQKSLKATLSHQTQFFHELPPIFTAMLPEKPSVEVIDVITRLNVGFVTPLEVPKEIRNVYRYGRHNYFHKIFKEILFSTCKSLDPLIFALMRGFSSELVTVLANKIKYPLSCTGFYELEGREMNPLHFSILRGDFELCKYFLETVQTQDLNFIIDDLALTFAINNQNVDPLKYLVSKKYQINSKHLSLLTGHGKYVDKCTKQKNCKFFQMFSIIVPKIKTFRMRHGLGGRTALHIAVKKWNKNGIDECAKEMVKYLGQTTQSEMKNVDGYTPFEIANPEARKILIACKRKNSNLDKIETTKPKKSKMLK